MQERLWHLGAPVCFGREFERQTKQFLKAKPRKYSVALPPLKHFVTNAKPRESILPPMVAFKFPFAMDRLSHCDRTSCETFTMIKVWIAVFAMLSLTGWGEREPAWPQAGSMPDEPVPVPAQIYRSIAAGIKSYRPVEPRPWGEINRQVAPPGAPSSDQQPPQTAPNSSTVPAQPKAMESMPGMQH